MRKCHSSRRDAFQSVNSTPLARYDLKSGILDILTYDHGRGERPFEIKSEFNENAMLIKFHPSLDPSIIDWAIDSGKKGLILEGTGLGHVSRGLNVSVKRAIEEGVVVCMTSQCIWGRVNMNVYSTGRDLLELGVIPLEDMLSETALVKMMWTLGQTSNTDKIRSTMLTNLVGEISKKSPYRRDTNES